MVHRIPICAYLCSWWFCISIIWVTRGTTRGNHMAWYKNRSVTSRTSHYPYWCNCLNRSSSKLFGIIYRTRRRQMWVNPISRSSSMLRFRRSKIRSITTCLNYVVSSWMTLISASNLPRWSATPRNEIIKCRSGIIKFSVLNKILLSPRHLHSFSRHLSGNLNLYLLSN